MASSVKIKLPLMDFVVVLGCGVWLGHHLPGLLYKSNELHRASKSTRADPGQARQALIRIGGHLQSIYCDIVVVLGRIAKTTLEAAPFIGQATPFLPAIPLTMLHLHGIMHSRAHLGDPRATTNAGEGHNSHGKPSQFSNDWLDVTNLANVAVALFLVRSAQLWARGAQPKEDDINRNGNGDGDGDEFNNEGLHQNTKSARATINQRTHANLDERPLPNNREIQNQDSSAAKATTKEVEAQRHCEVLVHNISHTDLILSLQPPSAASPNPMPNTTNAPNESDEYCLCRPRFSAFASYSKRVLHALVESRPSSNLLPSLPAASAKLVGEACLQDQLIRFPCHDRSDDMPRYDINPEPSQYIQKLPIGFHLAPSAARPGSNQLLNVSSQDMTDLRVRGRDSSKIYGWAKATCGDESDAQSTDPQRHLHHGTTGLELNAVFFPLLATLLPRWHQRMMAQYPFLSAVDADSSRQTKRTTLASSVSTGTHNDSAGSGGSDGNNGGVKVPTLRKVIVLVSGVGTPRNWTHSIDGNSTQTCAELCKHFINTLYPDVTVVMLHSTTNVFRYDDNISFVQQELLPAIEMYRDAHAQNLAYPDETSDGNMIQNKSVSASASTLLSSSFSTEWRKSFHVTISFADGTPARNHAIQAALRPFRPVYFHFWQLKTFWHSSQIVLDDLEVHSFEDMNTTPAIETTKLQNAMFRAVTQEIMRFQKEITDLLSQKDQLDLLKFWLRKTHKPVLAVLAVQLPDWERPKLYRGTNMEVSMPTGSLCAERNVIGTALAANPGLRRQDLKCISVLAVCIPQPSIPLSMQAMQSSVNQNQPTDDGGSGTGASPFLHISRTNSAASILDMTDQDIPFTSFVAPKGVPTGSNATPRFRTRQDSISEHSALPDGTDEDWILHPTEKLMPISAHSPSQDLRGDARANIPFAGHFASAKDDAIDTPMAQAAPARQVALYEAVHDRSSESRRHSHSRSSAAAGSHRGNGNSNSNVDTAKDITCDHADVVPNPSVSQIDGAAQPGAIPRRKVKRTVVIHAENDINPLKPCGSCNEWLKKIAESNPYFRILTYTDKDCNGVYCKPCEE